MRIKSPESSDEDSFKYSILISLHCYDIFFHPERVSIVPLLLFLLLCDNINLFYIVSKQ